MRRTKSSRKRRKDCLKIGVIGCGAIGSVLARAIVKRFADRAHLVGICDTDEAKAQTLARKLGLKGKVYSQSGLIRRSDLIVEATSPEAASGIVEEVLSKGKDVLAMSTGGLVSEWRRFVKLARSQKRRIYLPSGALCGMDALKAASLDEIYEVILTTRKPPRGLRDAPFIVKRGIDLDSVRGERVLFEGSPEEAIKAFPKNINISATLRLALLVAPVKVKVRILTSPSYKFNAHQLEVKGRFGQFTASVESIPSPENPKTSFLAILSAMATLKELLEEVQIGT